MRYQFTYNDAVISGLGSENQIPLNLFRWCSWADLVIRVDKYHSFGIKNSGNSSNGLQPCVNYEPITPVTQDESFYVPRQMLIYQRYVLSK